MKIILQVWRQKDRNAKGKLVRYECANVSEHKNFDVDYPKDYPDAKLAGKTYHYSVEVLGIKTKKLPELNDESMIEIWDLPASHFKKDAAPFQTSDVVVIGTVSGGQSYLSKPLPASRFVRPPR